MPKTKKAETSSSDSDTGPEDRNPPIAKKSKVIAAASSKTKDEPKTEWTLEKLRKVRINEFRGRRMIDIREFYEKNGELLPGKKGISLSRQQWETLLQFKDEINQALDK